MKTGLGGIPVAGSVLKATYDGLDKLISGHAANTLRDNLATLHAAIDEIGQGGAGVDWGNSQGRDDHMLAMAIGLQDPVLGPQVLEELGGTLPEDFDPDDVNEEVFTQFIREGGPTATALSTLAEDISQARIGDPT